MASPYAKRKVADWPKVTKRLIDRHPLPRSEIVATVLEAWDLIFTQSTVGGHLRLGADLFPRPQILGEFLHELVPYLLEVQYPGIWRRDQAAHEKDLVYIPDGAFSVEMKTSSSRRGAYGNRSFSQPSESKSAKKEKSGYYLIINFPPVHTLKRVEPISLIRFGWLDHEDWTGQKAPSGQQASLSPDVLLGKLEALYLG
jgi:hypothetical protein